MGIPHQLLYVFHRIGGCLTGSESGCSDIDGIGSVVDGCDTLLKVLGWRE